MAVDAETEVAQNLRAEPVAQADILESDHAVLRNGCRGELRRSLIRPSRQLNTSVSAGLRLGLVSNPLTDRLLGPPAKTPRP